MKKIFLFCCLFLLLSSCRKAEEPIFEIQTSEGIIKVKLYKETPKHRDNFVKLANSGYYNEQLLYKVVSDFLIETGDLNSRKADHNRLLGGNGIDYTIAAEIEYPKYFHKRGVLSAARLPDTENPEKNSNGSLFYIILGKNFTPAELDSIEKERYDRQVNIIWQRLIALNRSKIAQITSIDDNRVLLETLQDSLAAVAEKEVEKEGVFFFSKEQREAYTSIGGVPFMDEDYTVFGEIIAGMEVLEKISHSKVDFNSRPKKDIRIISIREVGE
ncbi:MAG: peptidylprolyl isomerase [Prevotellaceae bacterium]|jgi:cyclophilin family peptidyl-prolyl cis-trans isomerase|nr:peptidylprolyl isomerase [Prevotellaceae bacterium]